MNQPIATVHQCLRRKCDITPPCVTQCQGCSTMASFDLWPQLGKRVLVVDDGNVGIEAVRKMLAEEPGTIEPYVPSENARSEIIEECARAIEPASNPLLFAATKVIRALKNAAPQVSDTARSDRSPSANRDDVMPPAGAAPINQCDGCQRGLPLRDGKYHDLSGTVGAYPGEVMGCTADRDVPSATERITEGPFAGLPKPHKVPEGYVLVDEKYFRIILDVLTEEQTREVCRKEGERLFKGAVHGATLNEDGSVTPARPA